MLKGEIIPVGTTTSSKAIRYVVESDDPSDDYRVVEMPVSKRDWLVTDAEARTKAALEQLGELDDYWRIAAQWFIDEKKNAAALCVFRPKNGELHGAEVVSRIKRSSEAKQAA